MNVQKDDLQSHIDDIDVDVVIRTSSVHICVVSYLCLITINPHSLSLFLSLCLSSIHPHECKVRSRLREFTIWLAAIWLPENANHDSSRCVHAICTWNLRMEAAPRSFWIRCFCPGLLFTFNCRSVLNMETCACKYTH